MRLIKGSHIVVPRLTRATTPSSCRTATSRIVFVIPYERDFSVIGTTDIPVEVGEKPVCTPEEIAYLCEIASHYMEKPVTPADVVWTYSGVRPLFDDGDDNPSAVTRDYHLEVDAPSAGTAPLLSVFGGKITTYRRLAEHALARSRARTSRTWAWTGRRPGRWPTANWPTRRPSRRRSTATSTAPHGEARPAQGPACASSPAATARASTTCWKA